MTDTVKKLAPEILAIIKSSHNILLHCHPSPDPDSVGSALAMKFAIESLGAADTARTADTARSVGDKKKVTVIGGDSPVPQAFSHFPGFASIVPKNFFEIDLAAFDLFIIQDAGSLGMISRKGPLKDGVPTPVSFPESLKTITIDHHISNEKFGRTANLVDASYPATALLLFDLFKEWGIPLTHDIAANLFIGIFTDTGGFRYSSTTSDVFAAATELSKIAPNFPDIVFKMENSREPAELVSQGIGLNNIEAFPEAHVAIASITQVDMKQKGIVPEDASSSVLAGLLKSVIGWDVGVGLVEVEPGKFKGSLRTRDSEKYDLSKIALALGGGGHKAAAGIHVTGTLAEAKKKIVEAVRAVL